MSRVPRLGPYRVSGRLAQGPDGEVYRVFDVNTDAALLLVVSAEGDRERADRVALRLAGVEPRLVVRSEAGPEQVWASLPADEELRAVGLVGLDEVPRQNWFAEAYGWPHLYPKTASQLAMRIAVTLVGAWLLVSLFFWFR